MAILTVTTFLTLDGVMQSPGGPEEDPSGGFDLGGWIVPLFDEDTGAIVTEWFDDAEAFLLGRRTYEIFAAHWPNVDDDDQITVKLNHLPKYVASRTLSDGDLTWAHSAAVDDVAATVRRLKDELPGALQVHGSGDLVHTLVREGLVDEFRLLTFPVVVGTGQRLFPTDAPVSLEMLSSTTTTSGAVAARYRPTGAPQQGSFALDQ